LARGDLARRDLARGDLARGDLARGDLARRDLARRDLARRDLARGDLARGDLATRGLSNKDHSRQREFRTHAGPPSVLSRSPASGFLPGAMGAPRPIGTRAISTQAGLLAHESSSGPAFSPFGNDINGPGLVASVAGAAASRVFPFGDSRFSPCGPPVSVAVITRPGELAR
jgi:hypothetical protein